MATLYLIRHGQASFGKADYDQLSDRGWEQGRVLGRWLAGKVMPTAVFAGDLKRHQQTFDAIAEGFGTELPELSQLPGLNEFDHTRVIEALKPAWADREVMAQELAGHAHPAKAFQLMFAEAVRRWVSDENAADYPESWSTFRERVLLALRQAAAEAKGGDILVVSSGGPIAVVMQALLGLTDDRALALNEVIANTSVTRVLFSGERMSLSVFNSYGHLESESPALVTFR
ncbi:histidine phosphatase family protein [Marinobacter sp. 1Y8]